MKRLSQYWCYPKQHLFHQVQKMELVDNYKEIFDKNFTFLK